MGGAESESTTRTVQYESDTPSIMYVHCIEIIKVHVQALVYTNENATADPIVTERSHTTMMGEATGETA